MKNKNSKMIAVAALGAGLLLAAAAQAAPDAAPASAPAADAAASEMPPMVPPAKPGVYSQTKVSPTRYKISVKGHVFTSRDAIEKYLLFRAAELALADKFRWFTLNETRTKGDTAPIPKSDPTGLRYSFRMQYWRPVWRYKVAGSPNFSSWSPFGSAPFFADGKDPKTITDFEVTADITMHQGQMDDANPLAFEPSAVDDLLVNQVSPPE
jgi:hypothetical protein